MTAKTDWLTGAGSRIPQNAKMAYGALTLIVIRLASKWYTMLVDDRSATEDWCAVFWDTCQTILLKKLPNSADLGVIQGHTRLDPIETMGRFL